MTSRIDEAMLLATEVLDLAKVKIDSLNAKIATLEKELATANHTVARQRARPAGARVLGRVSSEGQRYHTLKQCLN